MSYIRIRKVFMTLLLAGYGAAVMGAPPTAEEMWEIIQEQQKTIEELKSKLEQTEEKVTATESKVKETEQKVEATADAVEQQTYGTSAAGSWADRTSIGGYGELHYNNLKDQVGDDDLNRVDFHRFVLFFGHEFTEDLRFFSELELEHALAGDDAPGEIELEMAWIEMDLNNQNRLRAGLDILPVGLINLTHEPNTFYGVERNRVETEIIPTTWWEAVLGFNGEIAPGWNYDIYGHSGLVVPTSGSSAFRPRSGRLKVAEADDQDIAFTGRLRYTGFPGLELGVAAQYQNDITGTADTLDIPAALFEGHIDYKHSSGFGLRALYARWDLDDDGGPGAGPSAFNAETLDGWYIEPAYRFGVPGRIPGDLGIFARYENYDERNQLTPSRFENFDRYVAGMNWWPHPNVVFKFDVQKEEADGQVARLLDGFNLGLGYQF
jgi:hypothetical protein